MNTEPIAAKLTIDTTEYDKVLERVKADLASLGAALRSGVHVEAVKEPVKRSEVADALKAMGVDTHGLVSVRINFGAGAGGGEIETVHHEHEHNTPLTRTTPTVTRRQFLVLDNLKRTEE